MLNYLKRRFSSGDLQNELDDEQDQDSKILSSITKRIENTSLGMSFNNNNNNNANQNQNNNFSNIVTNFTTSNRVRGTKGPSPSAPSSPTKNISFTDSVLNAARVIMTTNNSPHQSASLSNNNFSSASSKHVSNREKVKILFVIDDDHTDWSKYFRHRKLIGDYEIRVEQVIYTYIYTYSVIIFVFNLKKRLNSRI